MSLVFASACGSANDVHDRANNESQNSEESVAQLTDDGAFYVSYSPEPAPIPFNEFFELVVTVYDGDEHSTMLSDVEVEVDVTMPAHGHGMTTEPKVIRQQDGSFLVEGMRFHMRSTSLEERWEIYIGVTRGDVSDKTVFEVMCCES